MVCPSGCQRKTPFFWAGTAALPQASVAERPGRAPACKWEVCHAPNLNEEIRECLVHAEECGRLSKTAFTPCGIKDYLDMDQRWLIEPAAMSLLSDYRISPSRSAGASRTRNSPPPARGSGPHFST
jgi:hypothetical protein